MHVINRTPSIQMDDPDYVDFNELSSDITFENVSFHYPSCSGVVLDKISITLERGKTTAIIGPSGSGKSTIVKLLERFYDPTSGAISMNGTDMKKINLREFRRKVGYVGQEP